MRYAGLATRALTLAIDVAIVHVIVFSGAAIVGLVGSLVGDLKLDMTGLGEASDYRRQLDINDSLVTTTFTSNGVNYTREYFASAADDVIVMRITADQPGKVGFTAHVDLPSGRSNVSNTAADGRITTKGTLSNNGLRFESQAQVIAQGGSRSDNSANVTVPPACGSTRPLTVALSLIAPPSATLAVASVVIVGVARLTTVDSLASLHAPLTGALFASPL